MGSEAGSRFDCRLIMTRSGQFPKMLCCRSAYSGPASFTPSRAASVIGYRAPLHMLHERTATQNTTKLIPEPGNLQVPNTKIHLSMPDHRLLFPMCFAQCATIKNVFVIKHVTMTTTPYMASARLSCRSVFRRRFFVRFSRLTPLILKNPEFASRPCPSLSC